MLLGFLLCFPETARSIVGNGSSGAKSHLKSTKKRAQVNERGNRFPFPNPVACLHVLWNKNTASIIFVGSILYTTFCCVAASMSTLFIKVYDLNYLNAGLVYLPLGIGGMLAAFTIGMSL